MNCLDTGVVEAARSLRSLATSTTPISCVYSKKIWQNLRIILSGRYQYLVRKLYKSKIIGKIQIWPFFKPKFFWAKILGMIIGGFFPYVSRLCYIDMTTQNDRPFTLDISLVDCFQVGAEKFRQIRPKLFLVNFTQK